MSSKTKIVVLHMKEVVYTAIFLALAVFMLILVITMFNKKIRTKPAPPPTLPRQRSMFPASTPPPSS